MRRTGCSAAFACIACVAVATAEDAAWRLVGELGDDRLTESSGLAASRRTLGILWTHNDSGDEPLIYAMTETGEPRGRFRLEGVRHRDFEDMAAFTLDGQPWLIVGDVGDNERKRDRCELHLLQEPPVSAERTIEERALPVAATIAFTYEDGPRDCEALAIAGEKIYLIEKTLARASAVYALDLEFHPDAPRVARRVGTVPIPFITAMDIASDDRRLIVCTYGPAYEFTRDDNEPWSEVLRHPPREIVLPPRQQGEALTYTADGKALFVTSEKRPAPLWRVGVEEAATP